MVNNEIVDRFYVGTTIRFTGTFYNWDNSLIDPDTVTFTVYDSNMTQVFTTSVTSANRVSLGLFYWLWTPTDTGVYVYEWKGLISNSPSIRRKEFQVINV